MREKYFQEHFLFISSRPIFQATTRAVTAAWLQRDFSVTAALPTRILSLVFWAESLRSAEPVMFLGSV